MPLSAGTAGARAWPSPELACAALGGVAVGALGMVLGTRLAQRGLRRRGRPGLYVGIDIGGTTIHVGLVDSRGELQGEAQSDLLGDDHDPGRLVARVVRLVGNVLKSAGCSLNAVSGVGICTPGLLDFERGVVRVAANLKGWRDIPLTTLLRDGLGRADLRVVLEHDANTALLAEVWVGAAQGVKDVVLLALGTGIGAAIICDGRLLRGSKGEAGELGHCIMVPDGRTHGMAGVQGIFEGYASATAVVARAMEAGPPDKSSLHNCQPLTCELIFKHAAAGDEFARQLVRETAKYLAIGCINCSRFYDPELVLFSGGVAQAGEQLLSEVRQHYAKYHWNIAPISMRLEVADAPCHAGLVGAAYAAKCVVEEGR